MVVHTRQRFFIFVLLYMLCNFKMTQHGFLSWAQTGFSFSSWGVTGSPGWFQNSGEFGIQLTIFTPMAVAFCIALYPGWNKWGKIFFWLMPITAVGSTLATSSRGALLGLIAAASWSLRSSKRFFRTAVLLIVVGSIGWAVTPAEFKARFDTAGEDDTSLHRLDRWNKAWATMKKYPLLGVGHKNWDSYYRAKLDYSGPRGSAKVHNIFFESGTEHGFLGLFTLIGILIMMFAMNVRTRRIAKEYDMRFEYYMAHGMDGAIIGMVISASFVTVLYYPYVWIHAAFVTCLYNSARRALPQKSRYRMEPQYG
jgi:O-antigen ligase